MTGCSRENAKKIAVGLGLVDSVYTEGNETMEENHDGLAKRTRIARIEAAAPELLEALEDLVEECESQEAGVAQIFLDNARAAIIREARRKADA